MGPHFALTTEERMGNVQIVSVNYANLPSILKPGNRILLDDGNIELTVESVKEKNIECRVVHGGPLSDHKSANLPDVCLDMPFLSEADQSDILFAIEHDLDFIALSFVRTAQDIVDRETISGTEQGRAYRAHRQDRKPLGDRAYRRDYPPLGGDHGGPGGHGGGDSI